MNSLIRFAPNTEMRRLQHEIDRVFDSFFPAANGEQEARPSWAPRVDLTETSDEYRITADVPGIHREDFEINVHDGVLSISGERRREERVEDESHLRIERSYGSFHRSFQLPTSVQHDAIEASYEDGVLHVRVPKAEESKPRRIEVA